MTEDDTQLAERMCIVTRQCRDEEALIRFVRSPEGVAVPDLARKLPGRGLWVGLSRELVAQAQSRHLFSKGFAAETTAPADLAGRVAGLLRQAALSYLSLARKAGEAVAGFMKVEDMLGRGRVSLLIHAAEAQPDGCRKLDRMVPPGALIVRAFRGEELDLAFARANVVHAAVAKGGLAERLRLGLRRIEIYEAPPGCKGTEERA